MRLTLFGPHYARDAEKRVWRECAPGWWMRESPIVVEGLLMDEAVLMHPEQMAVACCALREEIRTLWRKAPRREAAQPEVAA